MSANGQLYISSLWSHHLSPALFIAHSNLPDALVGYLLVTVPQTDRVLFTDHHYVSCAGTGQISCVADYI